MVVKVAGIARLIILNTFATQAHDWQALETYKLTRLRHLSDLALPRKQPVFRLRAAATRNAAITWTSATAVRHRPPGLQPGPQLDVSKREVPVESRNGGTITLTPRPGLHSATVIFAHGLTGSADAWIDTIREISEQLPWVKFILPTAPTPPLHIPVLIPFQNQSLLPTFARVPIPIGPVPLPFINPNLNLSDVIALKGLDKIVGFISYPFPSWFDLASQDGLEAAMARLNGIVEAEVAGGLPYNRVVLAGFSQGGALSLATGLTRPAEKKIGGVLAMSGFMPSPGFFIERGVDDVPVLQTHGQEDQVVNVMWAWCTHELLKLKGCTKGEMKVYPGVRHGINDEVVGDALMFLRKVLPNDGTKSVQMKEQTTDMRVRELVQMPFETYPCISIQGSVLTGLFMGIVVTCLGALCFFRLRRVHLHSGVVGAPRGVDTRNRIESCSCWPCHVTGGLPGLLLEASHEKGFCRL